jgi:hypothetical protein
LFTEQLLTCVWGLLMSDEHDVLKGLEWYALGPWTFEAGPKSGFRVLDHPEQFGNSRVVAWCFSENSRANARLIARAPELVDALRAARARIAELEARLKGVEG